MVIAKDSTVHDSGIVAIHLYPVAIGQNRDGRMYPLVPSVSFQVNTNLVISRTVHRVGPARTVSQIIAPIHPDSQRSPPIHIEP